LPFETTANLAPPGGPVGQDRAMRAIAFGAKIAQPGYNIFVTGPQGSGKRASIRRALDRMAAAMPAPPIGLTSTISGRRTCRARSNSQPGRARPSRARLTNSSMR